LGYDKRGPQLFAEFDVSSQTSLPQQKHGIVVCLTTSLDVRKLDDYGPISLLVTEYKLLARITARRLGPKMEDHLRRSQFCAVPENSILDAVATIHSATTYAKATETPFCVPTLDFDIAFDYISHRYMFDILRRYGIRH
jgi:hypothetical protein